jgi:hypothetical protein
MKAIKFEEKIVIRETPEVIFDFTQDYQNRLKWDTFLKKAELIHGAEEAGMGVQSYCVAQNGLGMTTEYVSFNRPKVVAIKMTQGPFFFNRSWQSGRLPYAVYSQFPNWRSANFVASLETSGIWRTAVWKLP